MSLVNETTFIRDFIKRLNDLPTRYPENFVAPPQTRPKRPVIFPTSHLPKRRIISKNSDKNDTFTIKVKPLGSNTTLNVPVRPSTLISDLKKRISTEIGVSQLTSLRLIIKGKALSDGNEIREYDLKEGSILHLMVKPVVEDSNSNKQDTTSKSKNSQLQHGIQDIEFWKDLKTYLQNQLVPKEANKVYARFLDAFKGELPESLQKDLQ